MTDRHHKVSCGTSEIKSLDYIKNSEGFLNKSKMARDLKINRTTLLGVIIRLEQKQLIEKISQYSYTLTTLGEQYLTSISDGNMGVRNVSRGCQKVSKNKNLSSHYLKFKFPLNKEWIKINTDLFKKLNIKESKLIKVGMGNLNHYNLEYDNLNVKIFKKQVVISLHELIDENVEDNVMRATNRALKILPDLKLLGLETNSIKLDEGHYARVESFLADALQKIDDRYFLELDDGTKFWIDNSGKKKPEDETNTPESRENLDHNMIQQLKHKYNFNDIEQIKAFTGELASHMGNNFLKLQDALTSEINLRIEEKKSKLPQDINIKEDFSKIDYVG